MLKITTNEDAHERVLQLEGRLEGPWVTVLAQCWSSTSPELRGRHLRVHLNGVTFVDARGKALLAEMHVRGARLVGEDIETKAIVAEIQGMGSGSANEQVNPQRKEGETR